MTHAVSHEELMRHLDGELDADRRAAVQRHVESCTECRRELEVFGEMKRELEEMEVTTRDPVSAWSDVSRQLTRPIGWMLLIAGVAVWAAYGAWTWLHSPDALWEKLAAGAVMIGLLMLLLTAVLERLEALKTDPYKDVHR